MAAFCSIVTAARPSASTKTVRAAPRLSASNPEASASGEEVEDVGPVKVEPGGKHVEDSLLDPIGRGANRQVVDRPQLSPFEAARDHPHGYSRRRATPTAAANR